MEVMIEDVFGLIEQQSGEMRAAKSVARDLSDFDYSVYHTAEEVGSEGVGKSEFIFLSFT